MPDFRQIRPFKILALVMVAIAAILTITSLAGPEWVSVSFYHEDKVRSWGLWWNCFKVHTSFEMCLTADWLVACAALVFFSLLAQVLALAVAVWGLSSRRRVPYLVAGGLCCGAGACLIICLIIYPVMFTMEVKENKNFYTETSDFSFDWTYGIAWGAVIFLMCATIFFFVRVREENDAQPMKLVKENPLTYYSA
ncbi:hypothetical protein RRG08_019119 [Elysia crispata]|uniref:Uncharacterized protein n=1 Tax=Elysia crispata TaxID=231223 RepID=A0AAE0ZEH5_9GAST|nr:hypothetical protein RRG08_019119 [Elysia crispata]